MSDHYDAAVLLLLQAGVRPPSSASPTQAAAALRMCLPELGAEALMAAAMGYARSGSPFWPTPGQLLQQVPVDKPEAHYTEGLWLIKDAMRRVGFYGDIESHTFSSDTHLDAAVRAGIRACGGWRAMCQAPEGDAPMRACFRDAFTAAYARSRRAVQDRQLLEVMDRAGIRQLEASGWQRADGGGK